MYTTGYASVAFSPPQLQRLMLTNVTPTEGFILPQYKQKEVVHIFSVHSIKVVAYPHV